MDCYTERKERLNDDRPIAMTCTGCRKDTPHEFVSKDAAFIRYRCTACGRAKLLTVKEMA